MLKTGSSIVARSTLGDQMLNFKIAQFFPKVAQKITTVV